MKVFNGRYKVIKVIGQGAYGEINLAEDIKHARVVPQSTANLQDEKEKLVQEL
jgi:serine/threonine protein kinase